MPARHFEGPQSGFLSRWVLPIPMMVSSENAERAGSAEPQDPEAPLTADQADPLVRTLITGMVTHWGPKHSENSHVV